MPKHRKWESYSACPKKEYGIRPRKYLTSSEIDLLMKAEKIIGRHCHRVGESVENETAHDQ